MAFPTLPNAPEAVSIRSLFAEAYQEAQVHKWIESQKCGYDRGNNAIEEWYRLYWPQFCRIKRIEHLVGAQCWEEYPVDGFGKLHKLILSGDLLTDRILDRVYCQYENLTIINWGLTWGMPMSRVHEILRLIDVNSARIDPDLN